jgi:hypothetical protein
MEGLESTTGLTPLRSAAAPRCAAPRAMISVPTEYGVTPLSSEHHFSR